MIFVTKLNLITKSYFNYKHFFLSAKIKNMSTINLNEKFKKIRMTPIENIRILVLDLGTTNTRVRVFDGKHNSIYYKKLNTKIISNSPKCSEIDAVKLWENVVKLCHESMNDTGLTASNITCMGITTQRESFLIWDKVSCLPVMNINTWQDRRAEDLCHTLNESPELKKARVAGTNNKDDTLVEDMFTLKPNLASLRLHWTMINNKTVKDIIDKGQACFGTVESWIVYKLTGGKAHITDIASASITGMFDMTTMTWNYKLLEILGIPSSILPTISNTHGCLQETDKGIFGHSIPITCIIGDQEASTVGCGCFKPGITKCTFGTGIFCDTYTGSKLMRSSKGSCCPLVGWRGDTGEVSFVYETRNDFANTKILTMIKDGYFSGVNELEEIANSHLNESEHNSKYKISKKEAIELFNSIIFKFHDSWEEMLSNFHTNYQMDSIRVDGGFSPSNYLLERLSSILNLKIIRMEDADSTSKGAYFLARIGAGFNSAPLEFEKYIQLGKIFTPDTNQRTELLQLYSK